MVANLDWDRVEEWRFLACCCLAKEEEPGPGDVVRKESIGAEVSCFIASEALAWIVTFRNKSVL
jgi:hypothetical protein